jgi:hypothetical protein
MKSNTIWVDGWEMQCCGVPFKTGKCVKWTISKCKNDFLQIGGIDFYYDAHSSGKEQYEISGIVSNIQIVYALYELSYYNGQKCYIPASYKLANYDGEAGGWEKDFDDTYKFCAYLVQLDYENELTVV